MRLPRSASGFRNGSLSTTARISAENRYSLRRERRRRSGRRPGDRLDRARDPGRTSASSRRGTARTHRAASRSAAFSSAGPVNSPAARQSARRIDRLARVAVAPAADGVEVFQPEAQRVHAPVADRRRPGRSGAVPSAVAACPHVRGPLPSFSASTPDGGGDGGVPRMFSRIHLPRLTGERSIGVGRRREHARLGQHAAPRRAGQRRPGETSRP